MVHLYFPNFVSHPVYLLLLYLCIYWILFKSFLIFVIVFSGVVVRLVSAERGVLEIKTREEDAKRMFQSKTKLKDCCNLRQSESSKETVTEENDVSTLAF